MRMEGPHSLAERGQELGTWGTMGTQGSLAGIQSRVHQQVSKPVTGLWHNWPFPFQSRPGSYLLIWGE